MAKITINDVSRVAGVSVATVDRVLNRRPGVRAETVQRVERAIRDLNYQPDRLAARLARSRDIRFCFVLPAGANSFATRLREEVQAISEHMARERVVIDMRVTDVFDAANVTRILDAIGQDGYDGVAVVALDHPGVRESINGLVDMNMGVVTLVSDVPSSKRMHYAGIDNSAAGRTAASLLGRFSGGRGGKVGLIAGSTELRDHIERQFGFEQVLGHEFPKLKVLPVRQVRDESQRVEQAARQLLRENPDLVGIYHAGGGTQGLISALEGEPKRKDLVCIAHELTPHTRRALIKGTIAAVINQDPGHEARSAVRVLLAHAEDAPLLMEQERIRIDVFIRDNLP